MKPVLFSRELATRIKSHVEGGTTPLPNVNPASIQSSVAGYITPCELTRDWEKINGAWVAKIKRLWFNDAGKYESRSGESDVEVYYPLSEDIPPCSKGDRAFAVFRGRWEIMFVGGEQGDPAEKELFPVVVFQETVTKTIKVDSENIDFLEPKTYLVCPGGYNERSLKKVHAYCIEDNKTTDKFGKLLVAMNNFAAVNVGGKMVCLPGNTDLEVVFPTQIYDFATKEWTKNNGSTLLAGCPASVEVDGYGNGSVVGIGGSTAYYVGASIPVYSGSGGLQFYGHSITSKWSVDQVTGTVKPLPPLRVVDRTLSPNDYSNTADSDRIFLKQNFAGIQYKFGSYNRGVDFIAVGGVERLSNSPTATVSYFTDESGTYVASEKNPNSEGKVITFADSPVPLGECGAVHVTKYKNENVNWLVAIGGRMLGTGGEIILHEAPHVLDLNANIWRNDILPPMPTPRYNAGISPVVNTIGVNHDTNEVTNYDRIYVIAGRTKEGLTNKIESLNLTTGEWETNLTGL